MANMNMNNLTRSAEGASQSSQQGVQGRNKPLSDTQVIEYHSDNLIALNSLSEEVKFTLSEAIKDADVSISSLEVRVKEIASLRKKIKDKEYSDFSQITDLVGARVICPFRSDLIRVREAIERSFDLEDFDDKALDDPDKFGYMSLHFLCKIKETHRGPRYDRIKGRTFEVQARTICMHAWSSIQHSLEYKGEWDVPAGLRKDINALSALFYLADSQFESVFKAKANALAAAVETSKDSTKPAFAAQEINLETLTAYAATKFPERTVSDSRAFSVLSSQLHEAGYKTIGQIDRDIDRALDALKAEEAERERPFENIGAVRIALSFVSRTFEVINYGSNHNWPAVKKKLVKE